MIPAAELVDRFMIPAEALEEHLALLNLVNFGGGCYAVYAELRGDNGPRRQGAVRRHVPFATAADAARGAGDPARARVRRADDRRRGAPPTRQGAAEARGNVRPVRPRADGRASRRPHRRAAHRARSATASSAGGSWTSSTSRSVRKPSSPIPWSPTGSSGSSALVRPYVGPHARRRPQLPARPDALRDSQLGRVRAARGLRARSVARRTGRTDPLLEAGRALGGGTGRAAATRRVAPRPSKRSVARVARRGDPSLPRRGRRARPAGPPAERRRSARESSCQSSASPASASKFSREGDTDPRARRARGAPLRGRPRSVARSRTRPHPPAGRLAQPSRRVGAQGPAIGAETADPRR